MDGKKLTSSLQSREMGQWSLPAVGPLKGKPSEDRTGGSRGTLGLSQDIPCQEAKTLFPELFGSKDSGLEDSPLHGTNQTCRNCLQTAFHGTFWILSPS